MDFFAGGAGDHGALAAEDARLRVFQRRAVGHRPGGGGEAVAVAMLEAAIGFAVLGHRLFQHLRLFALVMDFGQQPEVVPAGARVVGEGEEVAADQ
ncbi:hypothetical protein D3C85_1045450 [compost metagenome]